MSCLIALCLELGAGLAGANMQDSGIWYMTGPQYPHELHRTSPAASIGVAGTNWRAGVKYAGRFGADSLAIASIDPTKIACAPACFPITHWHGTGKVYGVYAQYVAHWGAWRAEAGPWIYRATWQENIPDFNLYGSCGGQPATMVHSCNVSTDKTSLGAMGGLGRDFGAYSAVVSVQMASDRGSDRSIVKNVVLDFSIRRSW